MSLINITLTNYTIQPLFQDYTNGFNERVIDNHIIFCDITGLSDNSFNLNIFPENKENSIQKFNVLFRNNNNDPSVTTMNINNIATPILLNNRDTTEGNYKINNQEFILTYNAPDYTVLSTIRKYN